MVGRGGGGNHCMQRTLESTQRSIPQRDTLFTVYEAVQLGFLEVFG